MTEQNGSVRPPELRRGDGSRLILLGLAAIAGFLLGYVIYTLPLGMDGGMTFGAWADRPFRHGGIWWAAAGLLGGGALLYALERYRR
jgi:hypothetical protein